MLAIKNKNFERMIDLDVTKDGAKDELIMALLKIPGLSKIGKINNNVVEKLCFRVQEKHPVRMQWIRMLSLKKEGGRNLFKVDIVRTDTNEYIRSIYALTTFELFTKAFIYMYCIGSHIDEY